MIRVYPSFGALVASAVIALGKPEVFSGVGVADSFCDVLSGSLDEVSAITSEEGNQLELVALDIGAGAGVGVTDAADDDEGPTVSGGAEVAPDFATVGAPDVNEEVEPTIGASDVGASEAIDVSSVTPNAPLAAELEGELVTELGSPLDSTPTSVIPEEEGTIANEDGVVVVAGGADAVRPSSETAVDVSLNAPVGTSDSALEGAVIEVD